MLNEIIRLIKVNTDNNLILLKELIEQRARLEKLEKEREEKKKVKELNKQMEKIFNDDWNETFKEREVKADVV